MKTKNSQDALLLEIPKRLDQTTQKLKKKKSPNLTDDNLWNNFAHTKRTAVYVLRSTQLIKVI